MIHATVLRTPIGPLAMLEHESALIGAGFTADPRELHARLHPSLRTLELVDAPDLGEISKAHEAYFGGDLDALDALTVHAPGPPVRERLWAALRDVRSDETVTYGELAVRAGLTRGARAAGQACAQNLIAPVIPCHRVVASTGTGTRRLNGYYYGLDRKEWLLRHETAG
ncbi:methylated-DNA--[protein]-cysteine S-methyltransferase [Actinomadura sp. HBU206391]|uniref:methylated-DNA--[protein]-cysteine S-methyltransferase n=1 Tax=Actinomadura sp. HBU206391 TaxID=2731692 RepID=UPI00164F8037|nr:methylated-DNA--[protein]-cysteine S-methyltransferase [Actinomadura sp. HBU206391]MBC6458666.1 methylated-DNA--[protein]-cysteine S-methyltransferase [Actinomadura sp. HBU206391]